MSYVISYIVWVKSCQISEHEHVSPFKDAHYFHIHVFKPDPNTHVALEYLKGRKTTFQELINKLMGLI